ncbi:MAG: Rap1a/Tai family immunity protein [Mangrovicoccus sp.]|nr:Rap1a/Tai family immunity protein [Mangrovicoccus sp.]
MRFPLIPVLSLSLAFGLAQSSAALADGHESSTKTGYTVAALLAPCQEADNDARDGKAAEVECEQYMVGFVDALEAAGMIGGADSKICLPEQNIPAEMRWAFIRWVYQDFTARKQMMASEAAMGTLTTFFACEAAQ